MTAFNGQVALVTGASTGIGRYLAEALASRGMAVAGSARGEDRLRAAMDAVAVATGGANPRRARRRHRRPVQRLAPSVRGVRGTGCFGC
jgi:NAD(P)-dependent dehydrogenase (short-subunit alcohol dehydrogenase family)